MADTPTPKKGGGPPTLGDVRDHAQQLLKDIEAKQPDLLIDPSAQPLPNFSEATTPLDADGKPLVAQEHVTVTPEEIQGTPDGGPLQSSTNADALAQATAEADAAGGHPTPQRNDKGQFVSDKPTTDQPTPQAAPTGTAAAEAAAANLLNKDEYEEIEYEDSDTGEKFVVLAKKDHAPQVKKGYARRSVMDRSARFLSQARPILEPLITDGRMRDILPLIQQAMSDPEYAQFVIEAFNRRVTGQPLAPTAPAAQAQPQAATPTAQTAIPVLAENEDPYMAQYVNPITQRLNELDQRTRTFEQHQADERTRQAQRDEQQRRGIAIMQQTHADLSRYYPDEFTGDVNRDQPLLVQAAKFARESGMIATYGESPATVILAYERLRADRQQAAASPAAQMLQQVSVVEQQVARANAQAVSPGAPATNTTKKPTPKPPSVRDAKGNRVDIRDFAAGALQYVQAKASEGR